MTIFPNGTYTRVTHLKDLVPHNPPPLLGFKHVGNEVWYWSPVAAEDSLKYYEECENEAYQAENINCSQKFAIAFSIDDHRVYLDMPISNFCNEYEPTNPDKPPMQLVSDEEFFKGKRLYKYEELIQIE